MTAAPQTPTASQPANAAGIGSTPWLDLYGVIYADPPWQYDFAETDNRKIENHYPTMTCDAICALKVPAAENAVLYLWATAPKLREALRVMDAWNFAYKSHAMWDKEVAGMGYWWRGQHELLLTGTRGNMPPPPPELRVCSVIRCRRGKHSQKPDEVRAIISKWYPNEKKLEMFARPWTALWPKVDGWQQWGNEV
jgi:N6-adenosine-specific RNA methylase IME4